MLHEPRQKLGRDRARAFPVPGIAPFQAHSQAGGAEVLRSQRGADGARVQHEMPRVGAGVDAGDNHVARAVEPAARAAGPATARGSAQLVTRALKQGPRWGGYAVPAHELSSTTIVRLFARCCPSDPGPSTRVDRPAGPTRWHDERAPRHCGDGCSWPGSGGAGRSGAAGRPDGAAQPASRRREARSGPERHGSYLYEYPDGRRAKRGAQRSGSSSRSPSAASHMSSASASSGGNPSRSANRCAYRETLGSSPTGAASGGRARGSPQRGSGGNGESRRRRARPLRQAQQRHGSRSTECSSKRAPSPAGPPMMGFDCQIRRHHMGFVYPMSAEPQTAGPHTAWLVVRA